MTIPMKRPEQAMPAAGTIEDVLIRGDLSKLTPQQRTEYYMRVCASVGLNPLTKPFEYLNLNNRLVLYARRDAADQLRKINGISIQILSQEKLDGLLVIHVKATDKTGRTDEDLGVVSMPTNAKGDAAANTMLKAITKAKRRVTLSISGLGFLDETEVEDIPRENRHVTKPEDIVPAIEYDEETGEPVDNIPTGNPELERMSKAMARPEFAKLQTEMRAIKDEPTLVEWGMQNKDRVSTMPLDWQDILRGLYSEQLADLRKE